MWILPDKDSVEPAQISFQLEQAVAASRFTARIELERFRKSKDGVQVSVVRLRNRKPYCGAHPGPCPVRVFERKHKNCTYLEGLDWVGFSQLLNDVLDRLNASARVFSFNREFLGSRYYLRRGKQRRIGFPFEYQSFHGAVFAHWTQGDESDFDDHCGRKPPAYDEFVVGSGTPGYACYTLEEEKELTSESEHTHV
jgi:hypothetical protein